MGPAHAGRSRDYNENIKVPKHHIQLPGYSGPGLFFVEMESQHLTTVCSSHLPRRNHRLDLAELIFFSECRALGRFMVFLAFCALVTRIATLAILTQTMLLSSNKAADI